MISDNCWIAQAENVCKQIRRLGRSNRICLLLLDPVPYLYRTKLSELAVEVRVSKDCFWNSGMPRTGLKLWLPIFFHSDSYILLDSDLIILSESFFDVLAPAPSKIKLIRESALFWHAGKKGITFEHHSAIIERPILQTGVMSFERVFWQTHFKNILGHIKRDPSEFGDMVAINLFLADNPQFLEPLSEETCLVLRPTGLGKSTRGHLSRTISVGCDIFYDGKRVLSIHYTNSNGIICNYDHIVRMVEQYEHQL